MVLKRSNLMASLVDIIDTSSLPLSYCDKTSLSTLPHEFHVFNFANVNDSCSDFFQIFENALRSHSNNTWHFGGGVAIVSPNDTRGSGCFQKCHVTFFCQRWLFYSFWRHFRTSLGLQDVRNNLSSFTGEGRGFKKAKKLSRIN